MILRARFVVPAGGPPIADGAVLVRCQRVAAVGRWRDFGAGGRRALDLGEVALLPGLVNAHCHLDYTDLAGQFPPPRRFTDWLRLMRAAKAAWTPAEVAASWAAGARMLLRTGVTTLGNIETAPDLLRGLGRSTPLRVLSFLEMICLGRRPPRVVLRETAARLAGWRGAALPPGLSPHAPYTTVPELLRLTADLARRRGWRAAIHVAESRLEFDMFAHARGDMADWLKRNGRDMSDCGLGSPVRHLERCRLLGANLLAVHANYLGPGDAALLGRRGVSVAHCPRSHAYFGHAPFPLRALARAGVNVCLGTDSLASVRKAPRQSVELNLFEEMRALALAQPWLAPRRILQMATVNAARALGLAGRAGALVPGAWADLIVLPFTGTRAELDEAILHFPGHVSGSMINGRWVIPPGE